MKNVLIPVVLLVSFIGFGQSFAEEYDYYIDSNELKKHVEVLSHDSLTGRLTGTEGQQKAARYIKNHFKEHKCKPLFKNSYYQPFTVKKTLPSGYFTLNKDTLHFLEDFLLFDEEATANIVNTPLVYVSDGVKNINKSEINKKFVLLTSREVEDFDNEKLEYYFDKFYELGAKGVIYATSTLTELKEHYKEGLKHEKYSLIEDVEDDLSYSLIFVDDKIKENFEFENFWQKWRFNSGKSLNSVIQLGTIEGEINPESEIIFSENVGAFIEPKEEEVSDETLVVLAHYDHLGIKDGNIYNGADDNATGVGVILETARLFSKAYSEKDIFKRKIIFLAVSAEEIGLLGSKYYVNNPSFDIDKTTAVLNIDMVGRENNNDENYSLYIIGGDRINDNYSALNQKINDEFIGLNFDYTYNDEEHEMNLFYRSDHYNFAKKGVPSIFYFGGFHEDYHSPTDTAEKINFEKLHKVTKLILHVSWKIASDVTILGR